MTEFKRFEALEMVDHWNLMDDKGRIQYLMKNKKFLPEYTINVDNDNVYVSFPPKNEEHDPLTLHFNEFGYYLLVEVLQEIGLPAELV